MISARRRYASEQPLEERLFASRRRAFVISFLINHESNSAVRRGASRSESKSTMLAGGKYTLVYIPLIISPLLIRD